MSYLTDVADFVAAKKLELAARNLEHLLKIKKNRQASKTSWPPSNPPLSMRMRATTMTLPISWRRRPRILDGAFLYYIDAAKDAYTADEKMNIALRAQRQTDRAINTWKN